ncbi:MAG TPA: ABC transporter substrate-binding protein [Gaiellaceae bacterium]|nr:ABC transporter substrate-binding protein [Gaiellaceae bacterium]
MRVLGVVFLSLAVAVGTASARPSADPGVSSNEIVIGGTVPLSGIAASYASVGRGAEAYFKYVNGRGGVNGRKITYKYVDDQYNPSQTVQATRELVQQERVFAVFNSLGTEHNLAVRSFLNAAKVPQLFVGSGATTFGRDYRRYPNTIGFLPSYVGEGKVYARHILKTRPTAKIAVLYQNDDYGKDLLSGFKAGLGAKRRNIVSEQSYDPLSTDVASQVARLKASGAKVLMVIATPPFVIRGLVAANRLGWRPQIYVNQVGGATNIMRIVAATAGARIIQSAVTLISVKDPTSPRFRKDKGMALYRTIMKRYLPRGDANDGFHTYSMAVAYTFEQALRKAGRNPTRASLLRAVANLDIKSNPFLLPGVRIKTSATDHFPLDQGQLQRWSNNQWHPLGKVVSAKP